MSRKIRDKGNLEPLYTLVAFIGATLSPGSKWYAYFTRPGDQDDFQFFRTFEHVTIWHSNGGELIFILLAVHYLRMWGGVYFLEYDRTFNEAREKAPNWEKKHRFDRLLRVIVIFVLFAYALSLNSPVWAVKLLLSFQALILITYNILFFKEYYVWDKQKEANRFIAIGDLAYICFVLWVLFGPAPQVMPPSCELLIPAFLGAYAAVWFGETLAYYLAAVNRGFLQLWQLIRPERAG